MITNEIMVYFLAIMVSMGLVVALVFRLHFALNEMESRICGIWSNNNNTLRILIYNLNTEMKGEVVWNESSKEKIMGATVIRDMLITPFGCKGTYIDPVTQDQYRFRLKLKKAGLLCIRLFEKGGQLKKMEDWRLLK